MVALGENPEISYGFEFTLPTTLHKELVGFRSDADRMSGVARRIIQDDDPYPI